MWLVPAESADLVGRVSLQYPERSRAGRAECRSDRRNSRLWANARGGPGRWRGGTCAGGGPFLDPEADPHNVVRGVQSVAPTAPPSHRSNSLYPTVPAL